MSSPQHFMPGTNSGLPLQPAFSNVALELAAPGALRVEHRDLVLQLDESQPCHACCSQVGHDPGELVRLGAEGGDPLGEKLGGLLSLEVVHEHEPGGEVDVLASRS